MKALLYVNKSKPHLWKYKEDFFKYLIGIGVDVKRFELGEKVSKTDPSYKYCKEYKYSVINLNGLIAAECDFEVEKIQAIYINEHVYDLYHSFYRIQDDKEWLDKTCLNMAQIDNRLKGKNGYAIHIKNLNIFDYPKETGKFYTRSQKVVSDIICDSCTNFGFDCKKCPENYEYENIGYIRHMMKVYGEAGNEEYIAIPVTSEEMCRIANKEQSTLVRKKVLKEMLK